MKKDLSYNFKNHIFLIHYVLFGNGIIMMFYKTKICLKTYNIFKHFFILKMIFYMNSINKWK